MPPRIVAITRFTLIALLGVLIFWRGILPAFTRIDTDFPNYYTASRLVLEGKDVSRLYDDAWFNAQIASYGIAVEGKFSPFPPPTVFIMLPIASLSPGTAMTVWTILNIAALVGVVLLLKRTTRKSLWWVLLLVLFSGHALINDFRFGQCYLMLALLIILGYVLWTRNHPLAAGVLLGVGAAIKYFPLAYIPLMVLRKQWKMLAAFVLTIAGINGLAMATVGTGAYEEFFNNILMHHLSANMQDPFSSVFQSWNSLFRRLFVADGMLNPSPLFNWPAGFMLLTAVVVGTVIWISAAQILQLQQIQHTSAFSLQFSLLTITCLAILPASATYHFLLLIFPVALLISSVALPAVKLQNWVVAVYATVGVLPYHFVKGFDGQGVLTLVAYPRLWLMAIMFILTIFTIREIKRDLIQPTLGAERSTQ